MSGKRLVYKLYKELLKCNNKKIPNILGTSSKDGLKHEALPLCTTIAKYTIIPQDKYHPKLSENQTVWKSHNQGLKEATFIQTGRRGGNMEMCREACRHGVAQRGTDGNMRSHIHVWWIKIGRDISGVRDPSPRSDHSEQGSGTRKISHHNFWL